MREKEDKNNKKTYHLNTIYKNNKKKCEETNKQDAISDRQSYDQM